MDPAYRGSWRGDSRVRELDTENEDTDIQGDGIVSRRGSRFLSDPLAFTGTDLSDGLGALRRRLSREDSYGREEGSSTDEDDVDEDDLAVLDPQEREDILVQSAMARIQRAQAKGRSDVNLSKAELDALARRRRRNEEEAERRERRKRREQRIAIPLAQLESVSRTKRSGLSSGRSSRQSSVVDLPQLRGAEVLPPMGHFPPAGASSRTRQRSGTSSSQRPPSYIYDESAPPYDYVPRPSTASSRHCSDSLSSRPHSSSLTRGDVDPDSLNPFQFQTAGPRSTAVLRARSPSSGAVPHASPARSIRSNRRSVYDEQSSDEEFVPSEDGSTISDELAHETRLSQVPSRGRRGAAVIEEAVSVSPARYSSPSTTKLEEGSPVKRKLIVQGKKKKR